MTENPEPTIHEETLKLARACEARVEAQRKKFGDNDGAARLWDNFGMKLRRLAK